MPVAELLQEHGQLCHGLGDLHVGQVALEEDGALRPLGTFVVERIGGAHYFAGRSWGGRIFFFGHW